MRQDLLMDFLQISETLKLGKKHHKKKGRDEKHNHHNRENVENSNEEHSHCKCGGKLGIRKMSFTTRITLWLLLKYESLNQRNIAKTMNISAQAVSEIIKKLLEKELINKESGELNNENIITLTDEGKIVAEKIDMKMKDLSENIFKDFSEEEVETFNYLLGKIKKNKDELFDGEKNINEI